MKKTATLALALFCALNLFAANVSGVVSSRGKGLAGVRVTDGHSVVLTDNRGRYSIDSHPDAQFVYVGIPDGYTAPARNGAPLFYEALTGTRQKADFVLEPTGADATRHNFVVFADVQVYERPEIELCRKAAADAREVLQNAGVPAVGFSCGDIVGDWNNGMNVDIHEACAECGVPFFAVLGNHDIEFGAPTNEASKRVHQTLFGPSYYSFDLGKVHYVVLDDVFYYNRHYIGYLEEKQLNWLKADLATLAEGSPVFVFMHIPSYSAQARDGQWNKEEMNKIVTNRNALYDILGPYNAQLFTAHEHYAQHYEPRPGLQEHVHAPVSGVFWQSLLSWDGIPWGYYVYEVNGDSLTWYYKAVGMDRTAQFSAFGLGQDPMHKDCVVANVWNYDPAWKVEWYENGEYVGPMTQFRGWDRNIENDVLARREREFKWKYVGAGPTEHLFMAKPSSANSVVSIVVTDRFGKQYRWHSNSGYDESAILAGAFHELELNTEADGTFRTGEKWPGVWTRDISYSAILSLADIEPSIIQTCLMKKVDKLGRIIQDTGTGGSWPCSTDRVIWAVAAWEVYLQTGSIDWLRKVYPIIERSLAADRVVVYNPASGLYRGESSFIDWRVQSYPTWMEPGDIAQSECLGTNAVFYKALSVMAEASLEMAKACPSAASRYQAAAAEYTSQAEALKTAINASFWMPEAGYYGSYIYGRRQRYLQPRSETLGESLCVLWGIASDSQARSIFEKMPVSEFGPTIFWPQIQGQGSYHNNGIWPFVTAFYGLAAARSGCTGAMEFAIRSIWDSYLLAGSNMENRVASDGSFNTLLNSPRQLWSVAGNIGIYYKGLLGLSLGVDGLHFAPVVPWRMSGSRTIDYSYRGALLHINVTGCGTKIRKFEVDGVAGEPFVPATITGEHTIWIDMLDDSFSGLDEALERLEYRVSAADCPQDYGVQIAPVTFEQADIIDPAQSFETVVCADMAAESKKAVGAVTIKVPESGEYYLDCLYANGNGDISTYLKCANRSLYIDGTRVGVCVFPQRGDSWEDLGWSYPIRIKLTAGPHRFELRRDSVNVNMSIDTDQAMVFQLRLSR